MSYQELAWLYALAVGLTAAGLAANLWTLATDEEMELSLLLDPHPTLMTPLRVVAVLIAGPVTLVFRAFWHLIDRPPLGALMLALGLAWSFFQGVFILTWIFGVG